MAIAWMSRGEIRWRSRVGFSCEAIASGAVERSPQTKGLLRQLTTARLIGD
ncbi:MAG: hypothetical protein ACRC8Y_16740 [Chroococcales cyanobacterium]